MITTRDLCKNFISYQKDPGLWGSVSSLWSRKSQLKKAICNFDLDVEKGEIVGLLGPNGAGKTTLMKMFTGIIVPSSGIVKVNGFQPFERQRLFRKKIALVMGQKSQLWWDIPAMDSFLLLQRYYEIPSEVFKKRLFDLAELLQVRSLLQVHIRKLSLGERMKMELMATLLHQPDVLFLDEPTIGLDLIAQRNIREFLLRYHRQQKTTVILTSHYMADVEALCSRIVLVLEGRKRFDGGLHDFQSILGREKIVTFYFSRPQNAEEAFWRSLSVTWQSDFYSVEVRLPEDQLCSVSSRILDQFPVIDFSTEKAPIERVMSTLMTNPDLLTDEKKNG